MKVFAKRMFECQISFEVETRTWYVGVIRRTRNFHGVDSFTLGGHSLFYRVWDFGCNGIPGTMVVPPDSARVVATLEYNHLESGEVHAQWCEFGDEGWPRGFSDLNEFQVFLRRKIQDLELTVMQKILSGEVV